MPFPLPFPNKKGDELDARLTPPRLEEEVPEITGEEAPPGAEAPPPPDGAPEGVVVDCGVEVGGGEVEGGGEEGLDCWYLGKSIPLFTDFLKGSDDGNMDPLALAPEITGDPPLELLLGEPLVPTGLEVDGEGFAGLFIFCGGGGLLIFLPAGALAVILCGSRGDITDCRLGCEVGCEAGCGLGCEGCEGL